MITGFYFYRRWWRHILCIDDLLEYEQEDERFFDAMYTYATSRNIDPYLFHDAVFFEDGRLS